MSTKTNEKWVKRRWFAHGIEWMHAAVRRESRLVLLIAIAGWATCGTVYADSIKGSLGAKYQNWTLDNLNTSCPPDDPFNKNCTPYWDYPTNYRDFVADPMTGKLVIDGLVPSKNPANVGYCLTKTGGCNGVGPFDSTQFDSVDPQDPQSDAFDPTKPPPGIIDPPPGSIPFWGMDFDSAADTGGAIDPNFFFKRDTSNPLELKATMELQLSQFPNEINEFGWFETDGSGSMIGPTHRLFVGSPFPPVRLDDSLLNEKNKPDRAGTIKTFTPTPYYGYYYLDLSESNCFVATLASFNTGGCGIDGLFHNFAAFATDPNSAQTTFWIAGLNAAAECKPPEGADCNLTLVKVEPITPAAADLSVVKTDLPDPVTNRDSLTYTVTATNNGPNDATGVTVTDTLPNNVLFVSASAGCAELSGVVTCDIGSLANNDNAVFEIAVSTTTDGTITNTAQVIGNESDPDTNNNAASEDTVVNVAQVSMADLVVTKVDSPDPVTVGQNLTYTAKVANNGPDPATGVTLTDTLPSGVTFVSASTGCAQSGSVVSCTIGTLANGGSAPIQITVTPNTQGTIGNTAQVSANENDPDSANNTDTEQTTVSGRVTCAGLPATIIGTPGNNVINGTRGRDIINGLGGNDIIRGRRGNDVICGGRGRDRLFGQRGNDAVIGGRGNDICNGGRGRDSDGGCETRIRVP